MASTMAISFTLPPTPLPHLTFKRLLHNPLPKTFPFIPPKFRRRQARVLVAGARPIHGRGGGYVKYNESPSELRKHEGRGVHAKNNGEGLVPSNKKLHKILKLVAYVMLFGSADGDQNSLVEERRRELVLQYMTYNKGGAIVPEKEYYRHLSRLLTEWHTGVQEQEQRSREHDFRRLSKLIALMKKVFSWFRSCIRGFKDLFSRDAGPPWFVIELLLCVVGVILCIYAILFFPFSLIWGCLFRRPGPPPSPPPIDPTVVKKLLPFINPGKVKKLLPIDPSVVKDLLQLSSVNLATVATQLKTLIPVLIMVAALGTGNTQ